MMLWVLAHCNGGLIVHPEHRWPRDIIPKLPHQLVHSDDLLACFNSSNLLCFSCGEGNKSLQLGAPRNCPSANLHHIPSSVLFLFVSEVLECSLHCASTMLHRLVTIFGCCDLF